VEEYHFKDGSIYIAARRDDRTENEIICAGKSQSNKSPVGDAIKADLFDFKRVVQKQLSKGKSEALAKRLMDHYRKIGRKVHNVRIK
jgi:hypothetical protein